MASLQITNLPDNKHLKYITFRKKHNHRTWEEMLDFLIENHNSTPKPTPQIPQTPNTNNNKPNPKILSNPLANQQTRTINDTG